MTTVENEFRVLGRAFDGNSGGRPKMRSEIFSAIIMIARAGCSRRDTDRRRSVGRSCHVVSHVA
jgi:hypothetical protein